MVKKAYIWYHDRKTIGMLILFAGIAFQLFSFLKIPFLTTIHGYTIGMLMGFYNPFFYLFICYIGTNLIFEDKLKKPRWLKINGVHYWLFITAIVFIGVATSFYQEAISYKAFGSKQWYSFEKWYDDFTSEKNAWFPTNTNGGILGAFLYSVIAMVVSGIGALVISIILTIIIVSYIVFKATINIKYELKNKKNKLKNVALPKSQLEIIENDVNDQLKRNENEKKEGQKLEKRNGNENILPFDDPFNK